MIKGDYSYMIYAGKDGNIYAYNGIDNDIDFKGIDVARVVNNAIDILDGGKIFIKAGIYPTNSNLNIGENISFVGEGVATKFVLGQSGHLVINSGSNIKISDIFIDGTNQTNGSDPPLGNSGHLSLINAKNVIVDHVTIDALRFGINVYNTDGAIIQNNIINGKGNNDCIGGSSDNGSYRSTNVVIKNNIIKQDASMGNHYWTAIDLTAVYRTIFIDNMTYGNIVFGGEQYPHRYARISGNTMKPAIGRSDSYLALYTNTNDTIGNRNISITDNIIENGQIFIRAVPTKWALGGLIANNIIDGSSASYGIYLNYCSQFNIIDNIISSNKITLDSVTRTIIKGNQIKDGSIGIEELGTSSYNLIDGNYFTNVSNPISSSVPTTWKLNNKGYNPIGYFNGIGLAPINPTMPPSGTIFTNVFGYPCMVPITGGIVSDISINGQSTGIISGNFVVPQESNIKILYTTMPTWKWYGL